MSQIDLKIGPKIKAFRRQLGLQANKLAEEPEFTNREKFDFIFFENSF